ncbi:Crp/Fnr family transcriptional regulator [Riemerella anatipestifer]|uniref:Crp/Fnr family transcriptional regulator n=1 Tax=Riemerella anatipestifer TaxID=34085 RepID=UPI0021F8D7E9|nr:Crp/Fnr family transcriptional regulator [Riemerella anatipestifer]MCW0490160.1 Crp/Fnr family transcriptional regulator [Riemerella anatipestifer]
MSFEKQLEIEKKFQEVFSEAFFRKNLKPEDFEKYTSSKEVLKYDKGDVLFDDGELPKGVYFVEKGTAKLSKSGVYGKDYILRIVKEGDILGYRSLLCDENFQARAEAMTELETTFVPSDIFMQLLEADSRLSFAMMQKIAFELGESSNIITFLAQKTVRERLAEILLLLELKLGTDPEGFIKICLTREEVANLIGTATESAIRLISEFKNDGLIEVEGRSIKIKDHDKLKKVGDVVL